MRGRKKKPTELKKLTGEHRAHRLNDSEPEYSDDSILEPPDILNKRASEHWVEVVTQLANVGVMKMPDRDSMLNYCVMYDRFVQLEMDIQEEGMTVDKCGVDGDGNTIVLDTKINPKMAESRLIVQQLRPIQVEFGLTPSSRAKLEVPKDPPKDKMKDFMDKGKKSKVPSNVVGIKNGTNG